MEFLFFVGIVVVIILLPRRFHTSDGLFEKNDGYEYLQSIHNIETPRESPFMDTESF